MDNQLKIIFDEMLQTKASISDLITQKGFDAPMMTPEELDVLIQGMMVEFPQQLEEFRAGKESLLAFFLGQMMRKTKGKSNPQTLKERLKLLLGK